MIVFCRAQGKQRSERFSLVVEYKDNRREVYISFDIADDLDESRGGCSGSCRFLQSVV
jgi:hypothetical protein